MKTRGFLLILFSVLVLTGCSYANSEDLVVAQMAVATIQYEHPYKFALVQTEDSSTRAGEETSYLGSFDLVAQDASGAEMSRQSLNQSFGRQELTLDGPVNLTVHDYNADDVLDFALGFPVGDGSGEYQYVIYSVGKDGRLFTLPAQGYKEDGFVYTAAGNCSAEFTQTGGTGEGRRPSILVGIEKGNGGFEPAKYVWNGKQFEFEKENPFIITQSELLDNGRRSLVKVIQTAYEKPLAPDEQGFSIDENMYRGRFDIIVQDDSGGAKSQVSLNQYFGNDDLGFGGSFPLVFADYNKDGDDDFAIGRPEQGSLEFQYVLFSVNSEGYIYTLPAVGYKDEGFVYFAESGSGTGFPLLKDGETGFEVTLSKTDGGYAQGKYVWDGSKFVFTNTM